MMDLAGTLIRSREQFERERAAGVASFARRVFSELDLSGLDLSTLCFAEAAFYRVQLRGADLRGADLSRALLDGVDLQQARLSGVVLADALVFGSDLSGARFDGATLTGCDFASTRRAVFDERRPRLPLAELGYSPGECSRASTRRAAICAASASCLAT